MKTPYSEQVAETFSSSPAGQFGGAHVTTAEFGALRQLYEASGRDRGTTLDVIAKQGYPVPKDITPEMVAFSGAAHACGVAIDLAETRGIEGKDSTYESYTVKNRFDRFVSGHLPKTLLLAWAEPIKREPGYMNPSISYPEDVDTDFIYGVAKPHRYFPAQTMRYLEFARLGKLDDKTAQQFGIDEDTNLDSFGVSWDLLVPTIENADDLAQLSTSLAGVISKELLKNGLSTSQVATVIKKGYSIEGMQQEHGHVEQSDEVYKALLAELKSSPNTEPVAAILAK